MWLVLRLCFFSSDIPTLELSSVLDGAMLEQQDSSDCDYGGVTKTNINNNNVDNNTLNVSNNGVVNGSVDGNDGTVTPSPLAAPTSTSTTTTTTVKIHTTYKKRASKFMNRPNVQNGLGANSLLNPYGATGGIVGGGSSSLGANLSGGSRLFNNHSSSHPPVNSLFNNRNTNQHRSLTTRSSLFGGGSGGGGITSPQGTTTGSTTTTTVESRPPFVTTVTRGRFLPSKFDLMVEKSLFTFSSRPKPVGLITRHQCSLSGGPLKENTSENCQPRGAHDYFNVMWDPHVYRGSTTTLTSSLKQPDNELISSKDQERRRRRRAFLAGGVNNNFAGSNSNVSPVGTIGPSSNSNRNRYRMTTKVTSRSKTFPPPEGRHQVHVQTEEYLEDLTRDVTATRGPEVDAIVQTDPIEDDDLLSSTAMARSGFHPEMKSGIDASTQVLPGELFSFDERVQPIVEAVVGKILEQALLETMEEEEIGALKAQQNRFLEKRKEEERELKRLQEQQERISAEKERLKRHLELQLARQQQQSHNGEEQALLSPLSSALYNSHNSGVMDNGSENISGTEGGGNNLGNGMSTSYLLELLPSVINSLRQEGFITDQIGDGALTSFVPMWTSSSSKPDESSNGDVAIDDDIAVDDDEIPDDNDKDSSNQFQDGCRSRVNSPDIPTRPSSVEPEKELEVLEPQPPVQDDDNETGNEENENDPSPTPNTEEANEEIQVDAIAEGAEEPGATEENDNDETVEEDVETVTAPEATEIEMEDQAEEKEVDLEEEKEVEVVVEEKKEEEEVDVDEKKEEEEVDVDEKKEEEEVDGEEKKEEEEVDAEEKNEEEEVDVEEKKEEEEVDAEEKKEEEEVEEKKEEEKVDVEEKKEEEEVDAEEKKEEEEVDVEEEKEEESNDSPNVVSNEDI